MLITLTGFWVELEGMARGYRREVWSFYIPKHIFKVPLLY